MIDCLLDIKKAVDEAREDTDHLEAEQLHEFEARYQQVLDRGYDENPLEEKSTEAPGAEVQVYEVEAVTYGQLWPGPDGDAGLVDHAGDGGEV